MATIDPVIESRAKQWLSEGFDPETKKQVEYLLNNDPKELIESFYKDLEFGTGGLRGIMGVGTNRINKYTIGMATQGFANFLHKQHSGKDKIKVAIAFDCRNNSKFFTRIAAEVLSANNIEAYVFSELQPTPLLSYAVRELNCQGGIVITASHNPKEYNGYKVYGEDGSQLISPQDKQVIDEVRKIQSIEDVRFEKVSENIKSIPDSLIDAYIECIKGLSLSSDIIEKHKNLKIVFSPIHGTSHKLVPRALKEYGFNTVITIPEQDITDGNFPTVTYPNPEETAALKMALDKAKEIDAELVMATDPDGDRVGIAVKDLKGDFIPLNGNQTASIIIYYLFEQWKAKNRLKGKEYIVKTIVTSEILSKMAAEYNVKCFDVLTGFKYIAEIMRKLEGKETFIAGGEESYGYLIGDHARDKDAVIACCIIAEAAVWAKDAGKSLFELLIDIYVKFGFYKEKLISVTKKGIEGIEEIQSIMDNYRNNPPKEINNSKVILVNDYKLSVEKDFVNNTSTDIKLPKSNVIQIFLEDGTKFTMRPSGTEPKIKFYFGVFGNLDKHEHFKDVDAGLENKVDDIIKALGV